MAIFFLVRKTLIERGRDHPGKGKLPHQRFQFSLTNEMHLGVMAYKLAVWKSDLTNRIVLALLAGALAFANFAGSALADQMADFSGGAARAEKTYRAAHARFLAEPKSAEAAWQFARACFDRAEFPSNDSQRAALANQGIAACRQLIAREPKFAAAHYYLGMNLGQLARTKLLGALKIVEEMESEFKRARDLDEKLDFAGADRNLGLIYLDTPNWPVSIGNRSKAKQHFLRALQLSPDFPENHLNLIEAFLKWTDLVSAQIEAQKLRQLWPDARKKFTGEDWKVFKGN
jgi:tetratricopeptide (TPR) repeat protein